MCNLAVVLCGSNIKESPLARGDIQYLVARRSLPANALIGGGHDNLLKKNPADAGRRYEKN